MNTNPRCPRCAGKTWGRDAYCPPCGLDVRDFGPYAGESQSDRRQIMRKDRQDPLAEADDYAENLCLPGFELPRERPMVVQTFSDGEMTRWVQANSR